MSGFGVYVHWPYCEAICPYCDFNVYRARGRDPAPLLDAIVCDLEEHRRRTGPRRLDSLFLGGGTPSLLAAGAVARLIETCDRLWGFVAAAEITLEANPTHAEAGRFAAFAAAGVSRVSLGVQALDDAALTRLGRWHTAADARRAVAQAQAAFGRVSLDLIAARPDQTADAWARELDEALALGAEHLSIYHLTIEDGTAFARAAARGTLVTPGAEAAADLYDATQARCAAAGLPAYEVSNHARGPAARSVHNLIYWRSGEWAGVGPGAHGRLALPARTALAAARRPEEYVAAVRKNGVGWAEATALSVREIAQEFWLMGLRLADGIDRARADALGVAWPAADTLFALARDGLAQADAAHLRLTPRGRLVTDAVAARLA